MSDIDFEKMSDDEFSQLLDNIDDIEDDETIEDDFEDTDQDSDSKDDDSFEPETNQDDDDLNEDTDEEDEDLDEDEDGENSQDDDDDENDSDDETDDESGSDDEDTKLSEEEEEKLANATEGMSKKEKIDYRKAYEEAIAEKQRYEDFYNQVTSEFVANGKVMKGFNDPKKIIQAQQMAAGFSDKMKAFKKYRPFINPLKEKGIIDNPDKFNLMLNALDGDKEAIKKMIQDAEIDPVELDMEKVDYQPKNQLASDIEIAFDDVVDTAAQYGVKDRVESVIGNEWDDESVVELLSNPENSSDLVTHLSNGVYDLVQERIAQKKMTDPNGRFSAKRSIDQYREAAAELEQEHLMFLEQQKAAESNNDYVDNGYGEAAAEQMFSEEEIQAEMQRIMEEKEYAQKVRKQNSEVDKARKKAASVSKRKPRSKPKKAEDFDPAKLSDEEFEELLNSFMNEAS